jgi:hypothetical protein
MNRAERAKLHGAGILGRKPDPIIPGVTLFFG